MVARIGCREGPNLPTISVTPEQLVEDLRSRSDGVVAAGVGETCPIWSAVTVR